MPRVDRPHARTKLVGELPSRRARSRRSRRSVEFEKVGERARVLRGDRPAAGLRPEEEVPGHRGRVRRAAAPARRAKAMRSWLVAAVAGRPGVHRRRHRQPRHAGPRPRLGAGRSTSKFGTRAARGPGEGAASCSATKFPELDLRPRRHRRLVVRRVHGGAWRCCGGRTCSRRPSPAPRSPTGRTTTRTTPSATWACCRRTKKAYDEASLLPLAPKLKRPLLLVHGTADDNVYYRHTLELTDALFRAGQGLRGAAAAGRDAHGQRRPDRVRALMMRATGFFKKHLGEAK